MKPLEIEQLEIEQLEIELHHLGGACLPGISLLPLKRNDPGCAFFQ
jgi:hypothetical protein